MLLLNVVLSLPSRVSLREILLEVISIWKTSFGVSPFTVAQQQHSMPMKSSHPPSSYVPPSATHERTSSRGKDMSWRKPVPQFIPSPPPSPPPSSPANRPLPLTGTSHEDIPPLPVDWREAIERALTKDRWHKSDPMVAYGGGWDASVGDVWTRPTSPTPDPRWEFDSTGFTSASASTLDFRRHLADRTNRRISIYQHEERSRDGLPPRPHTASTPQREPARGHKHLHRMYRPPTPPLPTHYRKRRLQDENDHVPVPLVEPYRTVYPDTPTAWGHRDTVVLRSFPPSTVNLSYATLPRTQSIAGWDVPVLPVVLPGPSPLKKSKSSLSLTKTVVRRDAVKSSAPWWSNLLCVPRKGSDRSKYNPPQAKQIDLPGLPPVNRKRLSKASTVTLIDNPHSTPLLAMLSLWNRFRRWGQTWMVKE
ncbi:hypothetical protein GLOTRDRAFT_91052 [Gloeophyllum trabeum ATCC 11539]|uniref:Uncharacterized protein n=1 Tax=Gloeophyllum trabeum (strain ATCC 11539 / FP-39264 / Madison 617) TaxID=670483 RepID=S7QJF4_GLOTA|nr:uncharacterized protein GLOTRDRAFT_91052 [Gloeophyllum trabeum ATCC 11539]EPQ59463.1 hypothetical protein GLOTRDRAFT_91052 [Gloeophyllum trabeum ATCC 11539]